MVRRNLLNEKTIGWDHWWPKGLQSNWVNEDGYIFRSKDKLIERKKPKNNRTGVTRGGHFIKAEGGPWEHSFEGAFEAVDNCGPLAARTVIDEVSRFRQSLKRPVQLQSFEGMKKPPLKPSLLLINSKDISDLARTAISVVVRSPAFRIRKSVLSPAFFGPNKLDKNLGIGNIYTYWQHFDEVKDYSELLSKVIIFVAPDSRKLIFGDGFFENISQKMNLKIDRHNIPRTTVVGHLVFPLSHEITILFQFGKSPCSTEIVGLSPAQVTHLNDLTRQCSRYELFGNTDQLGAIEEIDDEQIRATMVTNHSFLSKWVDIDKQFPQTVPQVRN